MAQQRGAVHAGHAHVHDDDVARRAVELGEGIRATAGEEHLPLVALRAQRVAQAVQYVLLVVDEEDPRHAAAGRFTGSPGRAITRRGSRTWPRGMCSRRASRATVTL